jgi:hypothetical protein
VTEDLAIAQDVLERGRWTFAKTYARFAPHEWLAKGRTITPGDFLFAACMIQEHGVDEEFQVFHHRRTYRYLYLGRYKYWLMEDAETSTIINRVPIEGYPDRATPAPASSPG